MRSHRNFTTYFLNLWVSIESPLKYRYYILSQKIEGGNADWWRLLPPGHMVATAVSRGGELSPGGISPWSLCRKISGCIDCDMCALSADEVLLECGDFYVLSVMLPHSAQLAAYESTAIRQGFYTHTDTLLLLIEGECVYWLVSMSRNGSEWLKVDRLNSSFGHRRLYHRGFLRLKPQEFLSRKYSTKA